MKKEEIKNGNKLIAEFMGLKKEWYVEEYKDKSYGSYHHKYLHMFNDEYYDFGVPEFNKSWDLLMPITEKISNLISEIQMKIESGEADENYIEKFENIDDFYHALNQTSFFKIEIDDIYEICIEFIKWYNNAKI